MYTLSVNLEFDRTCRNAAGARRGPDFRLYPHYFTKSKFENRRRFTDVFLH